MAEFYLNQSKLEDLQMQESIVKLDEAEFGGTDFPYFAREAMQRYKESNPDLYKLILKMAIIDDDSTSLATGFIMDALNLFTKKLHLEISYFCKIPKFVKGSWQEVTSQSKKLVLPCQLLESTSLKDLSATYCVVTKPSDSIACLNLVSLTLVSVTIDDDLMKDILSTCHLIEYLYLHECTGLTKISLGKMQNNLKHFGVYDIDDECFVDMFEHGLTQYPNLISLDFNGLHVNKTFFDDSIVKFPSLTELSLGNVYGFEGTVEVSLPSLTYLNVEGLEDARWVFNVPSIRKFNCWGYIDIPPLNISTSSNEWESADIEFESCRRLPRSWFLGLQEFLQNLSVCKKISLSLTLDYPRKTDKLIEEDTPVSGVPCILVENLTFKPLLGIDELSLSVFSNHLSKLLSICRPNIITVIEVQRYPQRQLGERNLPALELLRKSVTDHAVWKPDLKQVTFEMLSEEEDETLREWHPILWDEMISSLSLKIHGAQIRLKLEWHGAMED